MSSGSKVKHTIWFGIQQIDLRTIWLWPSLETITELNNRVICAVTRNQIAFNVHSSNIQNCKWNQHHRNRQHIKMWESEARRATVFEAEGFSNSGQFNLVYKTTGVTNTSIMASLWVLQFKRPGIGPMPMKRSQLNVPFLLLQVQCPLDVE